MTDQNNRVRRINTSHSDDEIQTKVRRSQDYHSRFIKAIKLELEDEMEKRSEAIEKEKKNLN